MFVIPRGKLAAPGLVIDLKEPGDDTAVYDVSSYRTAFCLARRDGWPTAVTALDVSADDMVLAKDIWALIATEPVPDERPADDVESIDLTVAICTRHRLEGLQTTLRSLAEQTDRAFSVLIVDNSNDGELVDDVAHSAAAGLPLRVVHEPVPGLSWARNRALRETRTSYLAWLDDDEKADPDWALWVKRGFAAPDRPDVVAGLMLPAELVTQAQADFERYGGFNKGRGIRVARLRAGTDTAPNPLYPLPNFGAGGNMAFRTDLLRELGGFEPRLGAGTLTHGGEETLVLSRALENGATILHWPPAIAWHRHRRTAEDLEKQFFGYSAGLSAYYVSLIFISPRYLWRILRLVPRGIADLLVRGRTDDRSEEPLPADFPSHLLRASRRGLLQGGWLYLRERRRQRRQSRGASSLRGI